MSWTDALINPQSVLRLYDTPPSLDDVKLLSLSFNLEAVPTIDFVVALSSFPDYPPKRWRVCEGSQLLMYLELCEVSCAEWAFELDMLQQKPYVKLDIKKVSNAVSVKMKERQEVLCEFKGKFLRMNKFALLQ